jgi:hypothetical protein
MSSFNIFALVLIALLFFGANAFGQTGGLVSGGGSGSQGYTSCVGDLPASANVTSDLKVRVRSISGGVLNGKAISLPQPKLGKSAPKHMNVTVQVTVGEDGSVVRACGVANSPLGLAAAKAALLAKFYPTLISGTPVRVTGVIFYKS